MGPRIEFISVVTFAVIGQVGGQAIVHWAGPKLVEDFHGGFGAALLGVLIGIPVMFLLIGIAIGGIYLFAKLGLFDRKKYNDKYPGFH
jgi:hypothetical protein